MLLAMGSSTHQRKSQDRTSVTKFSVCEPGLSFEEATQGIQLYRSVCSGHLRSI